MEGKNLIKHEEEHQFGGAVNSLKDKKSTIYLDRTEIQNG